MGVSEENAEIVRSVYADPRGLTAAASDKVAPDAEFDFTAAYPDRPIVRGVEGLRRFRDSGPWGGSPIHFEQERYFDAAGLASVTGSVANTFPLRMTQHNDRHRARRGRASGASGPTRARDIVGRARNETGVTSGLVVGRAPRL